MKKIYFEPEFEVERFSFYDCLLNVTDSDVGEIYVEDGSGEISDTDDFFDY